MSDTLTQLELKKSNDELKKSRQEALDMLESMKSEMAISAEKEARFRLLFDSTSDAVFMHELKSDGTMGQFQEVNQVACDMLGYSRKRLLRLSPADIVDGINKENATNIGAELLRDGKSLFHRVLVSRDGRHIPAEFSSRTFTLNGRKMVLSSARDVSERRQLEKEREAMIEIFKLINSQDHKYEFIQAVTTYLHRWLGCEAIGIRLKENADFPYYVTRGFPAYFVKAEKFLCAIDETGKPVVDADGNPVLECMCGNILQGRFDPGKPFFTKGGSFWTNSTTDLLASTTEADRQARTRNRCNGEGYESVALIPCRLGKETVGLIQLNDRRKNCFTLELIEMLERMAANLTIALIQRRAEDEVRESEEKFAKAFAVSPVMLLLTRLTDGKIIDVNIACCEKIGYKREELIGQTTPGLGLWKNPDERISVTDELRRTGRVSNQEVWSRTKQGGEFIGLFSADIIDLKGEQHVMSNIIDVTQKKKDEQNMKAQLEELRRWQKVMMGRESRVIELKNEVNELLEKAGLAKKYEG